MVGLRRWAGGEGFEVERNQLELPVARKCIRTEGRNRAWRMTASVLPPRLAVSAASGRSAAVQAFHSSWYLLFPIFATVLFRVCFDFLPPPSPLCATHDGVIALLEYFASHVFPNIFTISCHSINNEETWSFIRSLQKPCSSTSVMDGARRRNGMKG